MLAAKLAAATLAVVGFMALPAASHRVVAAPTAADDPAYGYTFPKDFLFSSATASYQVEGAWNVSGKGENIWDRLTHERPELIKDLSNGDVACDSYHKYKEDIKLAKDLGTQMYRFSLSWSRLLPTGAVDQVNPDGVAYYKAIIKECKDNGITPMVTLFHWDLPQSLQDIGGFPNPLLADYIVDFAEVAFNNFGDDVEYWVTLNEPLTICAEGYGSGTKAPAIESDGWADYLCAHTLLNAHGRIYEMYDTKYRPRHNGSIGISANSDYYFPKDPDNKEDVAAAERWQQFNLGWYTHPIFKGDYPPVMIQRVDEASKKQNLKRSRLPKFTPAEVARLKNSADFFGLNTYTSTLAAGVKATDDPPALGTRKGDAMVLTSTDPNWETTVAPWHRVVPEGTRKLLNWIKNEYGNPKVLITENGYPDLGEKKDVKRVDYYRRYLLEVLKAMVEDNCNVIGYTAWSLIDNFEWFDGYTNRFGLHHVDFTHPDRPRTPKMSAKFFERVIATRKVPRDGEIVFPDDPTTTAATTAGERQAATTPAGGSAASATGSAPARWTIIALSAVTLASMAGVALL